MPPPLLENIAAWKFYLYDDFDKQYILDGIKHGFSLVDPGINSASVPATAVPNSWSVNKPDVRGKVEAQIVEELASGGYIFPKEKP